METDEQAGEAAASEAGPKPPATPESSSFQMANPSRVLPDQEKFIRFKTPAARFVPMKRAAAAGFVVLKDSQPGESPVRPGSIPDVADRLAATHMLHKANPQGCFCIFAHHWRTSIATDKQCECCKVKSYARLQGGLIQYIRPAM